MGSPCQRLGRLVCKVIWHGIALSGVRKIELQGDLTWDRPVREKEGLFAESKAWVIRLDIAPGDRSGRGQES
jgi:hypothetical protein